MNLKRIICFLILIHASTLEVRCEHLFSMGGTFQIYRDIDHYKRSVEASLDDLKCLRCEKIGKYYCGLFFSIKHRVILVSDAPCETYWIPEYRPSYKATVRLTLNNVEVEKRPGDASIQGFSQINTMISRPESSAVNTWPLGQACAFQGEIDKIIVD